MEPAGDDQHSGSRWRVSSHCNGGNCVEVARLPDGGVAIRDSKNTTGPVLEFTRSEWRSWIGRMKSDPHPRE
jgi:hypothetical protein